MARAEWRLLRRRGVRGVLLTALLSYDSECVYKYIYYPHNLKRRAPRTNQARTRQASTTKASTNQARTKHAPSKQVPRLHQPSK